MDDAIAGGISDARNGKIFNMFSLINVGERSGSGLCDIYNTWDENGFVCPEIKELINPDRVILTLEVGPASNEARNEARKNELNNREEKILAVIKLMPTMSATMLSEELGVSRSTVDRTIRSLKEKGYIIHEGSTKKGTWKILK